MDDDIDNANDPALKYFKKCMEEHELLLCEDEVDQDFKFSINTDKFTNI